MWSEPLTVVVVSVIIDQAADMFYINALNGLLIIDYLPSSLQLKLVNPTQYRFEHLATQLKWRLQEGRGEAVYQIGVEDNGLLVGLTEADMKASLKTLKRMAEK